MQLLTIVEDYVFAAMKRAILEPFDEDTVVATIPECPEIIVFGADAHECAADLYARLEDWVKVFLKSGYELPVLDEIDLNFEASRILAGYHGGDASPVCGEFFENEEELEAAFARHRRDA